MIYFCADDYGISEKSNSRIEKCAQSGVLNKISVLPNGELTDFKQRLLKYDVKLSLHINLIEGRPLSPIGEIDLLVNDEGNFKYSFMGLFLCSISHKRKRFRDQLYKEIKEQIVFWKKNMGENSLWIDSHQYTHMIPLVFKTLMQVIEDEGVDAQYLRIPDEPATPYLLSPSLYVECGFVGLIKHLLLKFFFLINKKQFKKSNINTACFMGVLFSGKVTCERIKKVLPCYLKIAGKQGRDIEIALHPGYLEKDETLMDGCRADFKKFYLSFGRKIEYDTLINFKFE